MLTTSSIDGEASAEQPGSGALEFELACAEARQSVIRYLRATADRSLDLDDLAGRCVEIAWSRRAEVTDLSGVVPWMLAIAANVVRNAERSSRRRDRLWWRLAHLRESITPHPSAHAELLASEPGPATLALASLAPGDRDILVLHAWEDLDPAGIAEVLGISRSAAAQRLHRARRRLERALNHVDRPTGDES